jgi:FkbM family methyltransferase
MNPVAHFTNDNGVAIQYHMNHRFAELFGSRNEHEVMFRRISTYLINNGHIRGNIIDLGAWIGDNALPWAKSLDTKSLLMADTKSLLMAPSAQIERVDQTPLVYAIDPSPDNCQFIQDLASLNNIQNIRIIQKAISDKREVLSTNDHLTHCTFVSDDDSGRNRVKAWPLDDLYNAGEIANVAFIHLDVEGMENRVIAGATTLIAECKPIIAFEQHLEQDPFIELSEYIASKGYTVYLINEVLPGCRTDCRNFIAFPNNRFNDKNSAQVIGELLNTHLGQDVLECVV